MGTENETLGFVPSRLRPTPAPMATSPSAPAPATSQISPAVLASQEELGRQAVEQSQLENTLLRDKVKRTISPSRAKNRIRGGVKGATYADSYGDVSTGGTGRPADVGLPSGPSLADRVSFKPANDPTSLAARTAGTNPAAAMAASPLARPVAPVIASRIGRPPAVTPGAVPPPTVTPVPSATRNGQDGSAVIIAGAKGQGFGFTPTKQTTPAASPRVVQPRQPVPARVTQRAIQPTVNPLFARR